MVLSAPVLAAAWALFVGSVGAVILRTGRVSRWRALLFVTLAWSFLVHFKTYLFHHTGSLICASVQAAPYCHIALATTASIHLYEQYLAFMSGAWLQWGPLSLGVLWLVVTLALGQAWCSWVCFYGGLDDGFSRILPKPLISWIRVPDKLRDFPTALLIFLLLISLTTMLPIFCLWICPLKLTTAFLDPVSFPRRIQLVLMTVSGIVFLLALPLLTSKRTFCGLICPFGAWQAFFGRLNPFRVTLDDSVCTHCGTCEAVCPIFAISSKVQGMEVLSYCNRCGQCLDACPTHAIRYTLLGHELPGSGPGWRFLWSARALFLFCALVLSGTMGALFVPAAGQDLFRLILR